MIPAELNRLRKKLKVHYVELAARTGLPSAYIEKILEGEVLPLWKDVDRIEKVLRQMETEPEDLRNPDNGAEEG